MVPVALGHLLAQTYDEVATAARHAIGLDVLQPLPGTDTPLLTVLACDHTEGMLPTSLPHSQAHWSTCPKPPAEKPNCLGNSVDAVADTSRGGSGGRPSPDAVRKCERPAARPGQAGVVGSGKWLDPSGWGSPSSGEAPP